MVDRQVNAALSWSSSRLAFVSSVKGKRRWSLEARPGPPMHLPSAAEARAGALKDHTPHARPPPSPPSCRVEQLGQLGARPSG